MTKEIRLLTGRHAGARIKLATTLMRIGNDDAADIQISDWDQPAMQLSQHEDGRITIADTLLADSSVTLDDFAPRRFGNIVLCAGDSSAVWPSDIALLESLLAPVPAPAPAMPMAEAADAIIPAPQPPVAADMPRKTHRLRNAGFAGAALLAIGCAGIALPAVLHPHTGGTARALTPPPDAEQLKTALKRLQQNDIEVQQRDGRFMVVGVATDSAAEAVVRDTLEQIAPDQIVWRLSSVDRIDQELEESLHDASLKVRYLGNRQFAVDGVAKNTNAVRQTLEQMRGDLAPMVTHIAMQVTPDDRMAPPAEVESLLNVDDLQYLVSSDGTKHFVDAHPAPRDLN